MSKSLPPVVHENRKKLWADLAPPLPGLKKVQNKLGLIGLKTNNKEDSTRLVLSEVSIIQTMDPIDNRNILRRCLTFIQTAFDIKCL